MSTTDIRTHANAIIAAADAIDAAPPASSGTVHAQRWFLVMPDGSLHYDNLNETFFNFSNQAGAEQKAAYWSNRLRTTVTATLCNISS